MKRQYVSRKIPTESASPILNSKAVRQRYGGISDMTLWRLIEDRRMGFPKPFRVGRLRFWRLREIERFEARRIVRKRVPC